MGEECLYFLFVYFFSPPSCIFAIQYRVSRYSRFRIRTALVSFPIYLNVKLFSDITDVACPALNPSGRGYVMCSRLTTPKPWRGRKRVINRPGTKCFLKCPSGYQLRGEYELTCGTDGNWFGSKHGECVSEYRIKGSRIVNVFNIFPSLNRIQQTASRLPPGFRCRSTSGSDESLCNIRSTVDGPWLVPIRKIWTLMGYASRVKSTARWTQDHICRKTSGIEETGHLHTPHNHQRSVSIFLISFLDSSWAYLIEYHEIFSVFVQVTS